MILALRLRAALVSLILVLCVASVAHAELRIQLPTIHERQAADVASWATSLTAIAFDTKASWNCADRLRCFEFQGARLGVVYGSLFLVKYLTHRDRPCAPACGLDNAHGSFWSGHTAVAFSTFGGPQVSITIPLAASTGALRVAAGKHWISDVLAGAGAGLLMSRLRP